MSKGIQACPKASPTFPQTTVPQSIVRSLGMGNSSQQHQKKMKQTAVKGLATPPFECHWHEPPYHFRLQSFTFEQFHVLLNSLFKVLFNFPSRYLFAIGLVLYLALDGVYHLICAAISNNTTQEYSHDSTRLTITGLTPSMGPQSYGFIDSHVGQREYPYATFPNRFTLRDSAWAFPCSLAVTGGILVSFFSSAYWYA